MNFFDNIKKLSKNIKLKTKKGIMLKKNIEKKIKVEDILSDIELYHNVSWYKELYNRNKNNLEDIALSYRGNKITYEEMFSNMRAYAKSLKTLGVGKDSEIPICLSNTPEIVYLLGAASLIGAKVNIFSKNYIEDYITEIINGCDSKVIFVEDNAYEKISNAIKQSKIQKIVMISLRDSLKNNVNPYEMLDKTSNLFTNKVGTYKKTNENIINIKEFVELGKNYSEELDAQTGLDTDFAITYTSGSTNEARPKAIIHPARSFITIARFHDKDLNGGFSMKNFTSLAHIPTYSNTNLISCISDTLMQGATLAIEPNYDKDFFIYSLIMYKPNYVAATKSFWVNASKKILYDERYQNVKFKNLLLAFSCGEVFEMNEEKLINKALRKAKAGVNFTHTPFSVVRMSEAAGDCEHGSILFTLFRSLGNIKPSNVKYNRAEGLKPFDFVEVSVLDTKGRKCPPDTMGILVANSPCTMKGYKNNPEATKQFLVTDSLGKTWGSLNVYGSIDENGKVRIKGRVTNEDEKVHPYEISDAILKDTKNILSCEVVKVEDDDTYVAHVEMQPNARKSVEYTIYSADERCKAILEDKYNEIDLYYRVRNNEESYPLTGSGKRDVRALKKEGLTQKCVKPMYIKDDCYFLEEYEPPKTKKKI